MKLRKTLDTGKTVRYHATLIDKKQNVAEHSWEVAIILKEIYPQCSADLFFYALTHDCAEMYTGDLPATVKKDVPHVKALFDDLEDRYLDSELGINYSEFSDEERLAVKYADVLSGIYFTTARVRAGDREALLIRDRWVSYLAQLPYLNRYVEFAIDEVIK